MIANKRKRRPAGTPDPDAEVVSLSPKTLLESDRYVCEICKQGFQRDQNLQMHRRRHKVPWKLLKRDKDNPVLMRKRVFVCPEPSCLHHHPSHALGDLVGIKKHFRRKHSNHKQWVCDKCCKAYAVQSDFKAHLKTCGTRGHSCDCGRVFSRVESFIEHQDACNMGGQGHSQIKTTAAETGTGTGSSPSTPSTATNFSSVPIPPNIINVTPYHNLDLNLSTNTNINTHHHHHNDNDESNNHNSTSTSSTSTSTRLQLSIGLSSQTQLHNLKSVEEGRVRMAVAEKSYAEEARQEAKRQIELAEKEFSNAKRMRRQAQVELDKATALKQQAIKQINSTIQQITCQACQKQFQPIPDPSLPFSVITTEAELSNPTPTPTP